jgi:hypothetical protein
MTTEKPYAQEILEEVLREHRQKASIYETCGDKDNARYHDGMVVRIATALAPFQAPKLAAAPSHTRGELKVVVHGGLPKKDVTQ